MLYSRTLFISHGVSFLKACFIKDLTKDHHILFNKDGLSSPYNGLRMFSVWVGTSDLKRKVSYTGHRTAAIFFPHLHHVSLLSLYMHTAHAHTPTNSPLMLADFPNFYLLSYINCENKMCHMIKCC